MDTYDFSVKVTFMLQRSEPGEADPKRTVERELGQIKGTMDHNRI